MPRHSSRAGNKKGYQILIGTAILPLLFVWLAGGWLVWKNHENWEVDRGFEQFRGRWLNIFALSVGVSFFTLLAAYFVQLGEVAHPTQVLVLPPMTAPAVAAQWIWLSSFAMGVVAFVLTFTGYTDAYATLAPTEIFHLGGYILLPTAAYAVWTGAADALLPTLSFDNNVWWQLGSTLLFTGIVFELLRFMGGLGIADIRGLWVIGIGLGWWIGSESVVILLIATSFIQALVGFAAMIFKFGRLIPNPKLARRKSADEYRAETVKIYGDKLLELVGDDSRKSLKRRLAFRKAIIKLRAKRAKPLPQVKYPLRRATPWLPVIAITFIFGPLIIK